MLPDNLNPATDEKITPALCQPDSLWLDFFGAKLVYANDLVTGFQSDAGITLSIEYNGNKKPVNATYIEDGNWLFKTQWSYNGEGQVSEEIYAFNLYGTGEGEKSKYLLTYNNGKRYAAGSYYFDASAAEYVYAGKMIYHWSNDNLVSTDHYDDSDEKVMTTTYSYDLAKLNNFYNAASFSQLLLGPPDGSNLQDAFLLSKNIMTRATESDFDERDYIFEYTYNIENLVHTITAKDMTNGGAVESVQKFFYKCD